MHKNIQRGLLVAVMSCALAVPGMSIATVAVSGASGDSGSTADDLTSVHCPTGGCITYGTTGDSGDGGEAWTTDLNDVVHS